MDSRLSIESEEETPGRKRRNEREHDEYNLLALKNDVRGIHQIRRSTYLLAV